MIEKTESGKRTLDLDRICFRDLWKNFVKENSKFKPCTIFEYEGKFFMRLLSTFQDERILQKENVMDKKTNYMISYNFQQPEMLLLVEEYYVVPTLDLIGLIGGTLGMFVGFSVYGTFADALSLTLSIAKKMTNDGKNFFLSLIGDYNCENINSCVHDFDEKLIQK